MSNEKDLLCLVMMVKNEAHGIEKTLLSTKDHVDQILILDTGSTDDTVSIIQKVLDEHQLTGKIIFETFVDFSTTRNRALALADECNCVFALMLSGDETVEAGPELRQFLESKRSSMGPFDEAFYINISLGCIYPSTRITRCRSGWAYHGATHEYICKSHHPLPTESAPGLIVHDYTQRTPEENREKWRRDEKILLREHKKEPSNARAVFYLAQTYKCLGDMVRAKRYYKRRSELGGWAPEVYEALYNIADITEKDEDYLTAYAQAPHRAEPLVKLAERWLDKPQVAYLYASHACELAIPTIGQFVFMDEEAYTFRRWDLLGRTAWYVGQYEKGYNALQEALRVRPNTPHLIQNLTFYTPKMRNQNIIIAETLVTPELKST